MNNSLITSNWKILLAIAALVLLVVVALGVSFLSGKSTPKPATTKAVPTIIQAQSTPSTNWQVYSQSDYSISYPKDVTATPKQAVNGRGLDFNLPVGQDYHMDLQVLPNTSTSVEKISSIFRAFHYQENDILIDNYPAKKFTGNAKIGGVISQEIAVIVEVKGQIYKLQLTYSGGQRNSDVDDLFLKILLNLKFS